MINYGGREMAEALRTVRKNTITIAEEVPEDKYSFRPTPDVRSVGELLAHIAVAPMWQVNVHGEHVDFISFEMFTQGMAASAAEEKSLTTKEQIVQALRDKGETFAAFLESLSEETLAETIGFPPPVQPARKTRFEVLLAAKEHEMHHRAQLTVYERLLGIVPHLTRARAQMATPAPAR